MTKQDSIQKYAEIKIQIAHLNDELKILQPKVLKAVGDNDGKLETAYGNFSVSSRKSYGYSQKLVKEMEQIKIKQTTEIEKGIATLTETEVLSFRTKTI